jgi:hypothetical protein
VVLIQTTDAGSTVFLASWMTQQNGRFAYGQITEWQRGEGRGNAQRPIRVMSAMFPLVALYCAAVFVRKLPLATKGQRSKMGRIFDHLLPQLQALAVLALNVGTRGYPRTHTRA